MKKNIYKELTDKELIKRKGLLKGAMIGFGIVFMLGIIILIYLFITKGFNNIPMATLIPVFTIPVTFAPLLISLSLLNKEIKSRN